MRFPGCSPLECSPSAHRAQRGASRRSTSCRLRSSCLRVEPVNFVTFATRRAKESMNETEKKIDPAQKESDQVVQRRANLEALAALGVDPYPHTFERTHTISRAGRRATARRPTTSSRPSASRRRPRAASWRSAASARRTSSCSPTATRRSRSTSARTRSRARFQDLQAARFRRLGRRRGPPVPHQDQRAHDLGVAARTSSPSACCRCRRSGTG